MKHPRNIANTSFITLSGTYTDLLPKKKKKSIKCYTTISYMHFLSIFRNTKAEKVAVIANSWGGYCFALTLNTECKYDCKQKTMHRN